MIPTNKYLLLLDPNPEVLSLQETALRCYYGGDVVALTSSQEVNSITLAKGNPELVIADSELVKGVITLNSPLIETTLYKVIAPKIGHRAMAVLEKPLNLTSFNLLIKSIIDEEVVQPTHVQVRTSTLLRQGTCLCDLYLRLSGRNFVKLFNHGDHFSEADFNKLSDKGVAELFIHADDVKSYLDFLERELSGPGNTLEDVTIAIEHIESLEKIAKSMNWSPDVLLSAQKSVNQAVKILSKNQSVMKVLKKRLSDPSSNYSRHIGLLTYLVCAFSTSIGFTGESGQVKLALAALIHDASVDDEYYLNIKEWDKRAADPTDKSPETMKYRMHPFEASKIVKSLDTHSPDVDQIILQHHEVKNGSGYPRGLDSHRIGHLPALFIIVEDLVEFIDNGDNIETSIVDFITWGSAYYDSGHFKKIFQVFQENLKQL